VIKSELLDYLASQRYTCSTDVSDAFGLSDAAAGMALLRLRQQGLATCAVDGEPPRYWYTLSKRGRDRRAYFRRKNGS
jgi:DNA-binding transcriptional ArsR family regulator